MRRIAAAALAAALALLLAACAGLPTSGDVNPGRAPEAVGGGLDVAYVPDGPQNGASADQIVQGFLRAGTGSQDNWATAKDFLTEDFARRWEPLASVTIDRLADRSIGVVGQNDATATVGAVVTATGTLDETGAYLPQTPARTDLSFQLERVDGQWRISNAPQGLVLFEELFRTVFRAAQLTYFDPSWQFLVPDVRWLPSTNIASWIVSRLIGGPESPWLVGSVVSAFPDGIVATAGPRSDGVAVVELGEGALSLDAQTLGRMQAQLDASMRSVDVAAVRMTAGGSALQATPATTRSTRVDSRSIVQTTTGVFGFSDGDKITAIGDISAGVESFGRVAAVETGPRRDVAAVLDGTGAVARVRDGGEQPVVLDSRPAALAPSVDPAGAVWVTHAGTPTDLTVFPLVGDPISVSDAWPEATDIRAMQVSRDGTRVAALVTAYGHSEVWVSGIRRTTDGTVVRLGEPLLVAAPRGDGLDLAWLDDATIGVLERVGAEVRLREQPVGGPGTDLTVPAGVVQVVGGNSSPRLLTDTGVVYARQGTTWQQVLDGVAVLAAQQGSP